MTIETIRMEYARAVAANANLKSDALRSAFATVPREMFLGHGPWFALNWDSRSDVPGYEPTPSADISHLYRDVVVAIDTSRHLNNGHPSFLASCLDSLEIKAGERVVHIGCGVGYYTAIIANVVGPTGHVVGVEIDPILAARARENLSYLGQVEVVHADGSNLPIAKADAIFVNAGVTDIRRNWLDSLVNNGRILVPLTTQLESPQNFRLGAGKLLKLIRHSTGFSAEFISSVSIFHCAGARDPELGELLKAIFARGDFEVVRSLRMDAHDADGSCWFHAEECCLSTLELNHRENREG